MSLELKLSNCNRTIKRDPLTKGSQLTVVEEDYWIEEEDEELVGSRQGFVCFSWKSPFQRYIDTCHLVKIQVVLEGYLLSHSISPLKSNAKKFYSSEVFCIRGIYGKRKLGELFPDRSLVYPFMLEPVGAQRSFLLLPSCQSDKLLSVAYRLRSRIVLSDPGQQRTPDLAISSYSHQLDYKVPANPVPSQATLDYIKNGVMMQKQEGIPSSPASKSSGKKMERSFRVALSDWVAKPSSQLEVLLNMDDQPIGDWRISAQLIQECCIEEGSPTLQKKVELFNIHLDREQTTLSLSIPFCLPNNLLPTLIEKDQRAKVAYHVKVSLRNGRKKKAESVAVVPLIVLSR